MFRQIPLFRRMGTLGPSSAVSVFRRATHTHSHGISTLSHAVGCHRQSWYHFGAFTLHRRRSPLLPGRKVRFPFPSIDQALVQRFAAMLAAGTLRPVIDRSYPLAEIVAAYHYVESGTKVGSVLLDIGGEVTAGG